MDKDTFLLGLQEEARAFTEAVTAPNGDDWIIKGFIDIYKRIYTISADTKVISKILELLLYPNLLQFAERIGYQLVLPREQTHYPDISFVPKSDGFKYALDLKSTYRTGTNSVNGMTLGTFGGYFRNRDTLRNITYPYNEYEEHFVFGVIYNRTTSTLDERTNYGLEDLETIRSAIRSLQCFVQPKYRIASARPGSGNTTNIGSVRQIDQLTEGKGPFAELGQEVFDDYWRFYLTNNEAKSTGTERPYSNLKTYAAYKNRGANLDLEKIAQLDQLDTGAEVEDTE